MIWDAYTPALSIPSIAYARITAMLVLGYAGLQDYFHRRISTWPLIAGLALNIFFVYFTLTDPRYEPLIPVYALQLVLAVPVLYVAKKRMGEGDLLALLLFFTATFPVSLSPWIYLQLLGSLAIYALHALARLVGNYSPFNSFFSDTCHEFHDDHHHEYD
jgi:Flp pilus assembly protein protease CpaA